MITIENVLETETLDLIRIQQTISDEIIRRCLDRNIKQNELDSYLNR